MKALRISAAADEDLIDRFDYYLEAGGLGLADEFEQRADGALTHIRRFPATGSLRYDDLSIVIALSPSGSHRRDRQLRPKLRSWALNQFPPTVFYLEHADHIQVVRLLHQASDIPAHLQP